MNLIEATYGSPRKLGERPRLRCAPPRSGRRYAPAIMLRGCLRCYPVSYGECATMFFTGGGISW